MGGRENNVLAVGMFFNYELAGNGQEKEIFSMSGLLIC